MFFCVVLFALKTDIWSISQPELFMLFGLLHLILTLRRSLHFRFNRDSWILFEKMWGLFTSWVRAFRFVSHVNFIFKIFLERIFRVTWECEKAYISQLCDEANTKMVLVWRLLSCVSFTCSTKTRGPDAYLVPCCGSTEQCWRPKAWFGRESSCWLSLWHEVLGGIWCANSHFINLWNTVLIIALHWL